MRKSKRGEHAQQQEHGLLQFLSLELSSPPTWQVQACFQGWQNTEKTSKPQTKAPVL